MVTAVAMTNAGYGYTNLPTVTIGPPPPPVVIGAGALQPGLQLLSSNLMPYENYQVQKTFSSGHAWTNFGSLLTATNTNGVQFWLMTNASAFYRMQYVP